MRTYAGKTAEERQAERRARLVEAALHLFGTQGYAATSARAVLRRAGLKERYFAESFSSMEELLAAVHDEIHDASFPATIRAMDPAADPVEQIRQMVNAIVSGFESNPGAARVKLLQVVGVGPIVEEHRRRSLRAYADAVAALLPQPPESAPLDRDTLAMALVTGINGMFADWLSGTLPVTRDQLVDHAVLLVRGAQHEVDTVHSRDKIVKSA
jgi:AcrR family transcriptional regulator